MGDGKLDVGSWMWEAGSGMSDVGSWMSDVGYRMWGNVSKMQEK